MKFILSSVLLLAGVSALPTETQEQESSKRQSIETVTDGLLLTVTLPQFISHRNALDPPSLDWTSDGCTTSPDNPFGFPFVPACNRHDFGYNNYRKQSRFTQSGKAKIDSNFKKDLYYQCTSVTAKRVCNALADVYYAAVKAFGGKDATPGKRSEDWAQIYEDKVAEYNRLVQEAQDKGDLPQLEEQ